jgi:hypothetical protein
MNSKLLSYLIAGVIGATFAFASPVFARGGGYGGGHFGGYHGGGYFRHGGGFSRFAYHHRFHRVGFYGGPFVYASYNGCWRRVRSFYGPQWVNVCSGYSY